MLHVGFHQCSSVFCAFWPLSEKAPKLWSLDLYDMPAVGEEHIVS
jgi:hypothetical protein